MNNYLEFSFKIHPIEPWKDILIAELIEIGFDSFTEEHNSILGYIPKNIFDQERIKSLNLFDQKNVEISYNYREMPNINWNEEWEKNFSPINIEGKVLIRAEFHTPNPNLHEIVIQPKMSFGTGHHPTTYLMIQQMLDLNFKNKSVLDMGCGTSILSIFAKKKGAGTTTAIDIDEWSVKNSEENAKRNHVKLNILQGTAENLGKKKFDIILANINRNILISDIPIYASVLNSKGILLLSGICFFDADDIIKICTDHDLVLQNQQQKEEWISLLLKKV